MIPQHQWASKLIGFNFQVEYKPGMSNIVADALSHQDMEAMAEVSALSASTFTIFDNLCVEFTTSPEVMQLL
jgi:hypothetical protein